MSKKTVIMIIIIVVAVTLGIGFYWFFQKRSEKYTGPVEKITLAGAKSGILVYIAQNQGYFQDNGLDVTIKDYVSGKAAMDALLTDEADIATSAEFVFVSNSFDYDDLRLFGVVATANICKLVARKDKGIDKPGDLKGKKIGVTRKSAGEFYLGTFLIFNGLTFSDVEIVDLKPSAIMEAMTDGTIDAALTWEPHVYRVKTSLQDNVVVWDGQSGQDYYFVLLTKEGWLKEHLPAAQRFMQAVVQAEEYVRENNKQASQVLADRFQLNPQDIQSFWPDHKFVVVLPQALILTMEDEARWIIKEGLTGATEIPNYLDFIYLDGLETVKPEAMTIIR